MSPPDSTSAARSSSGRAKPDVYTVMLAISLVAVLLGCTFLALELARYGWDVQAAGTAGL